MRIIIICCLFFLACNSDSKKSSPGTDNTSNVSNQENADHQKAEENIRAYAASHAKGKPEDFNFGKLEKTTGVTAEEVYRITCSFKETYDDGGNPMNINNTYILDKDLQVVRVEFN